MKSRSDRRRFVKDTVAIGGTLAFPVLPAMLLDACKTTDGSLLESDRRARYRRAGNTPEKALAAASAVRVRRSAHDPNNKDVVFYSKAFAELRKTKEGRDIWENFAQVHQNCCPHNNWFFLPWHRVYLYYFESMIRDVLRQMAKSPDSGVTAADAEGFALPYWPWDKAPIGQLPEVARKKGAPLYWKSDPSYSPVFGDRDPETETGGVDQRFVGPNAMKVVLGSRDFIAFASGRATSPRDTRSTGNPGSLESMPHNSTHGWMGGDMGAFMSPRDPVFWMHHCNVDRIWAMWAKAMGPVKELPPNTARSSAGMRTSDWLAFNLNSLSTDRSITSGPKTFYRYVAPTTPEGKPTVVAVDPRTEVITVKDTLSYRSGIFNFSYDDVALGLTEELSLGEVYPAERNVAYSAKLNSMPLKDIGSVSIDQGTKTLIFALDLNKWVGDDVYSHPLDARGILEKVRVAMKGEDPAAGKFADVGLNMYVDGVPQPNASERNMKLLFFVDQKTPTRANLDNADLQKRFLGARAFFSHDHGGDGTTGMVFDLTKSLRGHEIQPDGQNHIFIMVAVENTQRFSSGLSTALGNMRFSLEYYEG